MRGARRLLVLAAIGVALSILGALVAPVDMAQAWLAAFVFWIAIPVGSLVLLLVHSLCDSKWGEALRPSLIAGADIMPWMVLVILPILLSVGVIYPWGRLSGETWLDPVFFGVRAVVYIAIWTGIGFLARSRMDPAGRTSRTIAWPCLIIMFPTITLTAIDWIMSTEPHWTSTVYGLAVGDDWVVGALAFAILGSAFSSDPPRDPPVTSGAPLLIALLLLWAYFWGSQLVIVWEENLVHEIPWYVKRSTSGWDAVSHAIILLGFLGPFLLLIWRPVQQSLGMLGLITASILGARVLESWWLTVPDLDRPFAWTHPLALAAMGCLVLSLIAWRRGHVAELRSAEPSHV